MSTTNTLIDEWLSTVWKDIKYRVDQGHFSMLVQMKAAVSPAVKQYTISCTAVHCDNLAKL
jgi:hypothetical protein